jgi:hypothetical protein
MRDRVINELSPTEQSLLWSIKSFGIIALFRSGPLFQQLGHRSSKMMKVEFTLLDPEEKRMVGKGSVHPLADGLL